MDRVHYNFYTSLKYLDFDKFLKLNKSCDLEFNENMFLKANQKAFELVTYFLFKQLKSDEWIRQFRGCFPCLDKKHESDFRKVVMLHLKKLETDKNFNIKFLPGIVHNPGGDGFITLYLVFVNFIFRKKLCNLIDLNSSELEDIRKICIKEKENVRNKISTLSDVMKRNDNISFNFLHKLNNLEMKKKKLIIENENLNQTLKQKYGTYDCQILLEKLKNNYQKIKEHPLTKMNERYHHLFNINISNLDDNVFCLSDITGNKSHLDLKLIEDKLSEKFEQDKELFKKDFNNFDIVKLQQKNLLFINTNNILSNLMKELNIQINLINTNLENKKNQYLNQENIQKLIRLYKQNLKFNFPKIQFEIKKSEKVNRKTSFLTPNYNKDCKKSNSTPQENTPNDLNLSFSFAEISTFNFVPPQDESYI